MSSVDGGEFCTRPRRHARAAGHLFWAGPFRRPIRFLFLHFLVEIDTGARRARLRRARLAGPPRAAASRRPLFASSRVRDVRAFFARRDRCAQRCARCARDGRGPGESRVRPTLTQ